MEELELALEESFRELDIPSEQQKSLRGYMALLRNHHKPTYNHSIRTGIKGKEVAEFIHIVEPWKIYTPSLLHDLGKSKTSLVSLNKEPQHFNDYDRDNLLAHPEDAYKLLREFDPFVAEVALLHHCFQGERSYPKNPLEALFLRSPNLSNGEKAQIVYCSSLVGLIDVYDAATTRPSDKFSPGNPRPLTSKEAKELVLESRNDQKHLITQLYDAGIF